jgi:DNA-binding NarL/FixJ family response regulator
MNTPQKTIGIVDDHAVFRKGLSCFFETYTPYKISLEAANGKELQNF